MRFEGKVVVVVGEPVRYGRAATLRLAAEGALVVVVGSDAGALERIRAEVDERSGICTTIIGDPAGTVDLHAAAAEVGGSHGAVDALITYHLDLAWGTVEDCDIDAYARVVQHNMVGPIAATKAFLPLLKAAGGAAIVHIGSIDGIYGNPRAVAYSASKAGLVPLTHIMAREFAPYEIRVNTVATGQTNQAGGDGPPPVVAERAGMSATVAQGTIDAVGHTRSAPGHWFYENLSTATPLKRSGPPEEWAGTVAYLASDDASYVTGAVMVVDCGRTGLTPGTFPWDSPSTI